LVLLFVFPKQENKSQYWFEYPSSHIHLFGDTHVPFPEHTFFEFDTILLHLGYSHIFPPYNEVQSHSLGLIHSPLFEHTDGFVEFIPKHIGKLHNSPV
jgi:hypothetical protein